MTNDMLNILTVDLEDWFHILDNQQTQTEAEWERFESGGQRNILFARCI